MIIINAYKTKRPTSYILKVKEGLGREPDKIIYWIFILKVYLKFIYLKVYLFAIFLSLHSTSRD